MSSCIFIPCVFTFVSQKCVFENLKKYLHPCRVTAHPTNTNRQECGIPNELLIRSKLEFV